jgi:hypothetical protein
MRFGSGQRPQGTVAGIEQAQGMICIITMMLMMGVLMCVGVVEAGSKTNGRKQQKQRVQGDQTNGTESLPAHPPPCGACQCGVNET